MGRGNEYRAEVLPEDKARFVQAERAQGRTVVMIGGGINDSRPSAVNVGIAISDDDTLARDDFYGLYHEKLQAAIDPIQKSKEHLWFKKPGERKERRAVPEGTALRFHVGFFRKSSRFIFFGNPVYNQDNT